MSGPAQISAVSKTRHVPTRRAWRPSPQFILLVLMSLLAVAPFAEPGYFWGAHDARHNVYFLFQFDRSWQDGIYFPRWAPDFAFSYGYPFWIVYAPLATYVSQFFHLLGFGWEASVEIVFGLSIVASAIAMYGFVRSWAGRNAALVAGVAYVFIPYHLVDLYVRGALAESVALVFLPLCLWGFRAVTQRPSWATISGAALAFAGLMLTSNLVALVFASVLGAYLVLHVLVRLNATQPWRDWSRESILPLFANLVHLAWAPGLALILGFGLSAAFSVPALAEFRFVNRDQWYGEYYNPFNHFVYGYQLLTPSWGFGISQPGPDDPISFQLGVVPLALSILALGVLFRKPRAPAVLRREVLFFAGLTAVAVYLMLPASAWAWRSIPMVKFAQFPWRYLMLTAVSLAVLAGVGVAHSVEAAVGHWHAARRTQPEDDPEPDAGRMTAAEPQAEPRTVQPLTVATLALVGLLILGSYNYLAVEVRAPTPQQGPVSLAALMRFQQSSHEMTGVSAFVQEIPTWSPMAEDHVHGRPVTTHVDYCRVPQTEELAVDVREVGTAHELVWVHSGRPDQRLVFNIDYFPGWTAYIYEDRDNQPGRLLRTIHLTAADTVGPIAQIAAPLEEGEYFLLLRFEDTPVRVLGKTLTVLSLVIVAAGWVVRGWGRRWT